jgi:hypothetical protein
MKNDSFMSENESEQRQFSEANQGKRQSKMLGLYNSEAMRGSMHTFYERPHGSNKTNATNRQKPKKRK